MAAKPWAKLCVSCRYPMNCWWSRPAHDRVSRPLRGTCRVLVPSEFTVSASTMGLVEQDNTPTAESAQAAWTQGLVARHDDTPPARSRAVRRAAVASAIVAGLGASAYGAVVVFSAGPSAAAASARTTTDAGSTGGTAHSPQPGRPRSWRTGTSAGPASFGTVVSVGSKSFTLKTFSGKTVTVEVSSSTTYREFQVASPSFAAVKANEHVAVLGTATSGVVTAKSVLIGATGGNFGHGIGGWHGPRPGTAGSSPNVRPSSAV